MKNNIAFSVMQKSIYGLLLGFIFINPCVISAQVINQRISGGWKILNVAPSKTLPDSILNQSANAKQNTNWINAKSMPAMVHDILLQNLLIEEPWLPGKARAYTWVSENDWVYKTQFSVADTKLKSALHFGGLDCIVDIYLNGGKIASHSNMYMPLEVDVTNKLMTQNELLLHFHSPIKMVNGKVKPIHFVNDDVNRPVRRSDQSYSNYLGPDPYFSHVGIYGDVTFDQFVDSKLKKVVVSSTLSKKLDKGTVSISVDGLSNKESVKVEVNIFGMDEKLVQIKTMNIKPVAGSFKSDISLDVKKPKLWWPCGYGDQYLYKVTVNLLQEKNSRQTFTRKVGFRKVEMEKLFHFVVNNKPVKLWGGAWVSQDWRTLVSDNERTKNLFKLAENANFNAFRLWGDVEAPSDKFYELADEKGFMLWQDFTDLPISAKPEDVEICKTESAYLIERLMHHPSVFVWCGGNERALWYHKEYDDQLRDRGPWPGITATKEIEKIVKKMDPERYFMPNTPYFGIDPNDPKFGSTHGYTNIWFVPGYDYLNFASEDTRIAAPTLNSLKRFMTDDDIWPINYSPIYKHGNVYPFPESWLKVTTATSWKKIGPVEQFYDATDAASLVYRIGMAEALYYRNTIEKQRRGRDAVDKSNERKCGGYLVWKFNESWPQIYSAKVDYFLEPFHAYYTLKHAYQPVMLSFDIGSYIYLWAVNDSPEAVEGTVTFKLFHLDKNETRKEITKKIIILPGQSQVVYDLYKEGIGSFRKEHILFAELRNNKGEVIAATHSLADIERRITFPNAKLDVKIKDGKLIITTDKYAKSICLEGDANGEKMGWLFDDNYFDLMPGDEKVVHILGKFNKGIVSAKPWYSTNTTTINWSR